MKDHSEMTPLLFRGRVCFCFFPLSEMFPHIVPREGNLDQGSPLLQDHVCLICRIERGVPVYYLQYNSAAEAVSGGNVGHQITSRCRSHSSRHKSLSWKTKERKIK